MIRWVIFTASFSKITGTTFLLETFSILLQFARCEGSEYDDDGENARIVSIQSLARGWPDDPDTLELLRERAENDPTPWLREEAKELADQIETRNSRDR